AGEAAHVRRAVGRGHRPPQLGPEPGDEVHPAHRRARLAQRRHRADQRRAVAARAQVELQVRVRGGTEREDPALRNGHPGTVLSGAMAVPATGGSTSRWLGRTAWARNLQTPLRTFLRTETGGAAVLLGAALTALAWVNVHAASYEAVWHTQLAVRIGGWEIGQDLRGWVNNGLMTLFFFTVGLEARREFDLGELRDRRRVTVPLLATIGGMAVPVASYLAVNAGRSSAAGW